MPSGMPDERWLLETHFNREHASQRLYNEAPSFDVNLDPFPRKHDARRGKVGRIPFTRMEKRMAIYWDHLTAFLSEIYEPNQNHELLTKDFTGYLEEIVYLRQALEKLRMPGTTALKPEDEPTMFHENMLMSCYSQLEVLRATYKFVEHLREHVIKAKGGKTHRLKKLLPPKYDTDLLQQTQICFQAVRDVAQSYIDLILRRGTEAIKAQVRWGPTGEALKMYLSDEDVEFYAQEYVESALEAWRGVLKVKLK
jgi:N-terminal acetyltransferase B complex non-catalytic subunit